MDSPLKQRLIGAAVLVALAVIFLPMLLKGPDVREPDASKVPLSMPATPGAEYETRELPLTMPEGTSSPGGVLGMTPAEPAPLPTPAASEPAAASSVDLASAASVSLPVSPPPPPAPAATPVPPPTPAVPAAVAAGKYLVNIGTFSNTANGNALADKLRAQQLPVLVDKVSLASGSAMRVRVGPYADRATAEAARLRAEGVTGSAGKVVASDASTSPAAAPLPVGKAKPAPAGVSSSAVGFAVQLSAPSVEAEALALRDKARAQGFNAFVQPVDTDGGRRYRVRVGPVADRVAAEALRDSVNGKLGSKGIIVANP